MQFENNLYAIDNLPLLFKKRDLICNLLGQRCPSHLFGLNLLAFEVTNRGTVRIGRFPLIRVNPNQ